jgi:competence protein ComEA
MRQLRNQLQTHLAVTRSEALFVGIVATLMITGSLASRLVPWSEGDLHDHATLSAITATLDSITRSDSSQIAGVPTEQSAAPVSVRDSIYATATRSTHRKGKHLSSPISINSASINDLQRIPGVGPAMAKRIIERRSKARFTCPEDLLDVRGIGEKTLVKLRPYIVVP